MSNYIRKEQVKPLLLFNGIGIPNEDLPFVFDRFMKTNLTGDVGYGLGLAIVKSIAMYHQIQIDVQSEIGKGTTFRVVLPKNSITSLP